MLTIVLHAIKRTSNIPKNARAKLATFCFSLYEGDADHEGEGTVCTKFKIRNSPTHSES
jgi:hypothetical protein